MRAPIGNPSGTDGFRGVTAIELKAGELTVRLADPETVPRVAVMVAEPTPELVANPCDGAVLLSTATVASELAQVTSVVMFCVL